jgi:hypothetical protein
MSAKIDLTGKEFNYLTVIAQAPANKWGQTMWLCQCVCGNKIAVVGKTLNASPTKSSINVSSNKTS